MRGQAREWFRAELTAAASAAASADANPPPDSAAQARSKSVLRAWLESPDLAAVRNANAMSALPAAEQKEWAALWEQAATLLGGPRPRS